MTFEYEYAPNMIIVKVHPPSKYVSLALYKTLLIYKKIIHFVSLALGNNFISQFLSQTKELCSLITVLISKIYLHRCVRVILLFIEKYNHD